MGPGKNTLMEDVILMMSAEVRGRHFVKFLLEVTTVSLLDGSEAVLDLKPYAQFARRAEIGRGFLEDDIERAKATKAARKGGGGTGKRQQREGGDSAWRGDEEAKTRSSRR
ncbi:uncharacterized protein A4U43_C10F6940 [Asparagus officinalis]|uniref:Uncharacterized protein n=1 Tax=Asparagus officinalis TaxID=4686 RepID=A0A5P1E185_ASPOF|nr:uncharacterized protein A4U43_C10F6940 [Asparagus officinalis]